MYWSRVFLVLLEAVGNFLGFDFCPHSIIPVAGNQALVVRRVDNTIHRINHYPVDSVVCSVNTYPLDNDLSGG